MADQLLLVLSLLLGVCSMAWLALAIEVHWKQVGKAVPLSQAVARRLRALGAGGILASLLCCLGAEHPTIGVLVWVMMSSASAFVVTFTLAWRPRWLSFLAG